MTATRCIALAVAVAAALATPARAQSAEAESLFREGQRLMKKGQIAQACDKFEAAERTEATAGTELSLADCREKTGQLATAWALFLKAAATAKHAGDTRRVTEGRRRAAAIEPQLVYLTIIVSDEARIDGLVIKRNDAEIAEALWNQRVPVDPDEYTVSAEAPGYKPWSTSVIVKTKSKKVEVPVLDKLPETKRAAKRAEAKRGSDDESDAARAAPAVPRDRERSADETRPAPRMTGKRKWSIALAAVGVVGIGAGIGLGLYANDLEDQSDAMCQRSTCGDPAPVELNQRARRYALGANIGYAAGGAALVSAVVLWFVGAPGSTHAETAVIPTIGAGRIGVAFARSF